MNRPIKTQILRSGSKELLVTAVNLHNAKAIPSLPRKVKTIFDELAPFLKESRQVAYLRDIPEYAVGPHLAGDAFHAQEIKIAAPAWPADTAEIVGTFAHELHHLARWQNGGYGATLGDALVSEGMACLYAEEKSGRSMPWTKGRISQQVYDQARRQWNERSYDHQAWFFDGPLGKFVGYRLAYRLATKYFSADFDLARSLSTKKRDFKKFLP